MVDNAGGKAQRLAWTAGVISEYCNFSMAKLGNFWTYAVQKVQPLLGLTFQYFSVTFSQKKPNVISIG